MLRKHKGLSGIEHKKLIDIQIALANGAWARTKARQLIEKIEQAPTRRSNMGSKAIRTR